MFDIFQFEARWDYYLNRAAKLAWKGFQEVKSNPMVGAILIDRKGKRIGEGYHEKFGEAHAEVNAIKDAQNAGFDTKGTILFVTLEPCSHTGKQPPCTEAIINAGITHVVYAQVDPNPKVRKEGHKSLEKAGIKIVQHTTPKVKKINAIYLKNSKENRPFVHLKLALAESKYLSTKAEKRTQLTGEESNQVVHHLRSHHDGILVGVNTILIDNPQLTIRLPKEAPKQPTRIIIDPSLKTPHDAKILKEKGETWIIHNKKATKKNLPNTTLISLTGDNVIPPKTILEEIYSYGIRSIMIEGGAITANQFIKLGLVDRLTLICTPKKVIDKNAPHLEAPLGLLTENGQFTSIKYIGEDLWIDTWI